MLSPIPLSQDRMNTSDIREKGVKILECKIFIQHFNQKHFNKKGAEVSAPFSLSSKMMNDYFISAIFFVIELAPSVSV